MKKYFLLLMCLFATKLVASEDIEIKLKITNEENSNYTLTLGVSDTLTDNYDEGSNLERDMPDFPPSEGILPYFKIYAESQKVDIYSQADIKKLEKDSLSFTKKYKLVILGNSLSDYTLEWFLSPKYIRSAKILDEFGGNVLNIDMLKQSTVKVNRFLKDITIEVVYLNPTMDLPIEDKLNLKFYPNPSKDMISFSQNVTKWEIFDLLGNKIISGSEKEIDLRNFANACYLIKLHSKEGTKYQNLIKE